MYCWEQSPTTERVIVGLVLAFLTLYNLIVAGIIVFVVFLSWHFAEDWKAYAVIAVVLGPFIGVAGYSWYQFVKHNHKMAVSVAVAPLGLTLPVLCGTLSSF